ncbi:GPW/gp25 family protein [Flavilitoribacter nigricans]|uniref:GPW/gp25 family protein n=1 Tax=Flavilitoribacter nigricans TaxID=70997 RepID=UPI001474506F|nr:GPW/gp25 family protein [Flavilitoribacter nigricans]
MSELINKIIGVGWAFPPTFDPVNQTAQMVTGKADIEQSLNILFGTQPGERVLTLKYGCDLMTSLFQNISLSQKTILEDRIEKAITNFEPRIILEKVEIDITQAGEGIVYIEVDFLISRTNSRQNMVFPFFLREGTLVPRI